MTNKIKKIFLFLYLISIAPTINYYQEKNLKLWAAIAACEFTIIKHTSSNECLARFKLIIEEELKRFELFKADPIQYFYAQYDIEYYIETAYKTTALLCSIDIDILREVLAKKTEDRYKGLLLLQTEQT